MDKFLQKKPKHGVKTTAMDRQREFAKDTFVSGDKRLLYCKWCNIVLDHHRKSSISAHFTTDKHKKRKLENSGENSSTPAKLQTMITLAGPSTVASKERTDICQEWVAMCAAANIPLSKTDHPAVQQFLKKRVVNGGSIPHAKQLQECYLEREYNVRVLEIKSKLQDKQVALITDEMSDDNCRFVLNVLAAPLETTSEHKIKTYLLDTVYLEATNHITVTPSVLKTVQQFDIQFDNVRVINTDNASYMHKAFTTLHSVFPNSVHITCLAHVMNLLGDAFKKPFKQVTKFVKNMNALFFHANARKARYQSHIASVMKKKATMPPNPISTRWNCWYDAVAYHVEHFSAYKTFMEREMDLAKSAAPDSLKDLKELFLDDKTSALLLQKMKFITEKSEMFVQALNVFQSQQPLALKAWPMLEDLQSRFYGGCISQRECSQFYLDDFTHAEKVELQDLFGQAFALAEAKLVKYLTPEGQPGIQFLKDIQFFNPNRLIFFSGAEDVTSSIAIKELQNIPEDEIKKYMTKLGPNAVQMSVSSVNPHLFWASVTDDLPNLAALAKPLICSTVNSADAERSFSLYNLILSPRRRSLNEENMKRLCFLAYNQVCWPRFLDVMI